MNEPRRYFVYILASKKHGTLYIGICNDMRTRVQHHRTGKGSKFVKKYDAKIDETQINKLQYASDVIAMRVEKWLQTQDPEYEPIPHTFPSIAERQEALRSSVENLENDRYLNITKTEVFFLTYSLLSLLDVFRMNFQCFLKRFNMSQMPFIQDLHHQLVVLSLLLPVGDLYG